MGARQSCIRFSLVGGLKMSGYLYIMAGLRVALFLKVDAPEIGNGHHFAITFLFLGQGLTGCYLLGDYLPDRTFLGAVQFGQISHK